MIINYQFLNDHDFDRDRYYYVMKNLIASAKELKEEITIAERYSVENNGFIVSVKVGGKTQGTFAFRRFKGALEEMGGKLSPITLINEEELTWWKDK